MSASLSAPDTGAQAEPFVSYSINFEDVVLRRLFRGQSFGFFVDVGAEHPIVGNDFFGFYKQGWRGINVEPNPSYFALLQEHRPLDTNLQLALSDVAGQDLAYFEVEDTGLSTCDESQLAACIAQGYVVRRHDVRSSTLKDILDAAGSPRIDILKVDVEGLEEKVLLGNDWQRHRPSIIMVEVTYPQTPKRRPTGIRSSLETLGYRHIHFDNLNDFFVEANFDVPPDGTLPPNVFDRFVLRDVVALRDDNTSLRSNFHAAEGYARTLEAGQTALATERDALGAECALLRDTLGRERTAFQCRGAALEEALYRSEAAEVATRRLAIAAILGRADQLRALLATEPASEVEQEEGQAMTEQGRELVTIAGEGVTEGAVPLGPTALVPAAIRTEMIEAQLQASDERNGRLLDDIADLRHENRRLLASLRQAQGESLSIQRALGPSYATRDELLQLRETIVLLQSQVGQHHQAMSADFESRVHAAVEERLGYMSKERNLGEKAGDFEKSRLADAQMLESMLNSTSWRLTKPLRAFRNLFNFSRK